MNTLLGRNWLFVTPLNLAGKTKKKGEKMSFKQKEEVKIKRESTALYSLS